MSLTVSDLIWRRLSDWGVEHAFGFPGDSAAGLLAALEHPDASIAFVRARHQEAAAFMACGYAKFSGRIGVCLATAGSGLIHLLNGLCDAHLDHMPVVAIIGGPPRGSGGGHARNRINIDAILREVAGATVDTLLTDDDVASLVDTVVATAITRRSVACLIVPDDLQRQPVGDQGDRAIMPPRPVGVPSVIPASKERVEEAARLLNASARPAMLVGAGALGASSQVRAVAERLGAGVAKTTLGKGVAPDDLPYVTGALGLAGAQPSHSLLQDCDILLLVGTTFPYAEFLPRAGAAIIISINLTPASPEPDRPVDIDLVGDAAKTLDGLLPRLRARPNSEWSERIGALTSAWWRTVEQEASSATRLVHPGFVISTLSATAPEDCTIAVDTGAIVQCFARGFQVRGRMKTSLSGGLASMGASIPYALAAKFADPSRPAIALLGDGTMQMNGLNELITVAESWMKWASPQFVVIVLNNSTLSQVYWERRRNQNQAHGGATQEIANIQYHLFANMLGLRGLLVTRPEGLARAFRDAFAADRPVLIEVRTDPTVSPSPPLIPAEQDRELARAWLASLPEPRANPG